MDKWCKKESTGRETTAIKCTLNDVCVRKAIKLRINSGGQEAWVLNWSWHQAKGKKKGLWRLPSGSTLLICSRAFSLSSGHNKWSIDSLSRSRSHFVYQTFPAVKKKKKPTATSQSFWQRRAIKSKHSSWLTSTLSHGSTIVFVYSSRRSVEPGLSCSCVRRSCSPKRAKSRFCFHVEIRDEGLRRLEVKQVKKPCPEAVFPWRRHTLLTWSFSLHFSRILRPHPPHV